MVIVNIKCNSAQKVLEKFPAHGKYWCYSIGDSKRPSHQDKGYHFPRRKAFLGLEL